MLIVNTYLKETEKKGIGLFAKEKINKGDVVWLFNKVVDLIIKPDKIDFYFVPDVLFEFMDTYSTNIPNDDRVLLCCDNARFINHSFEPNIKSLGALKENIALRDINPDEELTINYEEIDDGEINFIIYK